MSSEKLTKIIPGHVLGGILKNTRLLEKKDFMDMVLNMVELKFWNNFALVKLANGETQIVPINQPAFMPGSSAPYMIHGYVTLNQFNIDYLLFNGEPEPPIPIPLPTKPEPFIAHNPNMKYNESVLGYQPTNLMGNVESLHSGMPESELKRKALTVQEVEQGYLLAPSGPATATQVSINDNSVGFGIQAHQQQGSRSIELQSLEKEMFEIERQYEYSRAGGAVPLYESYFVNLSQALSENEQNQPRAGANSISNYTSPRGQGSNFNTFQSPNAIYPDQRDSHPGFFFRRRSMDHTKRTQPGPKS